MGLINFFKYNNVEKSLLEKYSPALGSIFTEEILNESIKESKEMETYELPSNFGDIILSNKKIGNSLVDTIAESVYLRLPAKRKEGVRDEDIKNWWNLNDVERQLIQKVETILKRKALMEQVNDNPSLDKAIAYEKALDVLQRTFILYGESDSNSSLKGDDSLIPYELRERINLYISRSLEEIMPLLDQYSSFNALVRDKIRKGEL